MSLEQPCRGAPEKLLGGLLSQAPGASEAEQELPTEAFLLALLSLPKMGPARMSRLLEEASPTQIWERLLRGEAKAIAEIAKVAEKTSQNWLTATATVDVVEVWRRHCASGVRVLQHGDSCYPWRLEEDPDPPPALFTKGDLAILNNPTITIVGTRTCTRYGADIAFELGKAAAQRGVAVVSGLATGIDAAAHSGAFEIGDARVVGVVGSGLDKIYPRSNGTLWRTVAERGLMISEAPLGVSPERWRFPARNRVMAGLADVCVVVESHAEGGALTTAIEAAKRGRAVMAVPGPIRSSSSAGTNRLIADGAAVLCDVADIFVALDMEAAALPGRQSTFEEAVTVPDDGASDSELLQAFDWMPITLDTLVERVGDDPGEVAAALEDLLASGKVVQRGLWYERAVLA